MPTNVIMPQMGESVAEGTVVKWLKKVGDRVERDEALLEISTDKVDAEIPSPAAGVLSRILVNENETVEVNAVLAVIGGEDATATGSAEQPPTAPVHPDARPPEAAPSGDASVATRPAAPQTPAGPVEAPAESPDSETGREGTGGVARGEEPSGAAAKIRSSPLVRRIAREHNVELAHVPGTGLGGRISKKDILAYLAQQPPAAPSSAGAIPTPGLPAAAGGPPPSPAPAPPSPAPAQTSPAVPYRAPEIAFTGPTYTMPMTPIRRQIAEHMVLSRRTSAHVTTVFEVEMTRVFEARARHAQEFEQRNGIKLTYTPFVARAAVEAIKPFPIFNASVEGQNTVYKRNINLGVAVALETGLIVPVIKHADEKNFLGIARALQELAERARTKRLSVDDVQGGTFTITNPGVFGSLFGTPIIHQPQVAILGVGVIEKRAVVRNDAIAIRPMVYLALSFDHRVIDGAVADLFMARVKNKLENWDEALL
jgi:pyruvate dehydrogenase E2 component (dihydrolipoamide acetyltransferase)